MKSLFSLEGRTALVTGGSRGIGEMIAQGFLQHGAKVYISSRKADQCQATAERLSAYGECIALPHDISTIEGCDALTKSYTDYEDKLDILVNNAGAAWGEAFETFPESGWDKVMDLNVKSPFFLTQRLHDALKAGAADGRPAKVIMIASIDGIGITPMSTFSYGPSKAAIIHLTRLMAKRLITDNIIVSGIAPGAFPSNMNKVARDHGEELAKAIPARRIGDVDDMGGTAVYLASRAGDYVVGETVVLDGGAFMTSSYNLG